MIDPESQRVLDLARSARTPSDADKAAVERKLAAALGLWAGASAATAAAASSSKLGAGKLAVAGALKWWLAGSALIGASALGYVALRAPAAEPGHAQGRVPAGRIEHVQPAPALAPTPVAPVQTMAAVVSDQPVRDPAAVDEQAAERVAPARAEHARVAARGTQAAEIELLHRAQSAWRSGRTQEALTLLDRHRARFARSACASSAAPPKPHNSRAACSRAPLTHRCAPPWSKAARCEHADRFLGVEELHLRRGLEVVVW